MVVCTLISERAYSGLRLSLRLRRQCRGTEWEPGPNPTLEVSTSSKHAPLRQQPIGLRASHCCLNGCRPEAGTWAGTAHLLLLLPPR